MHPFKSNDRTYINPGSAGCSSKPLAKYALLDFKDGGALDIHTKEIPYNNREFLQMYDHLQVPVRESLIKIFHGNQNQL